MKFEKSCGIVVYRKTNDIIEFLAVKSKAFGHWGFAKGHVEGSESEQETAKRELLEETGLKADLNSSFRTSVQYSPKEGTNKEVVFFVGECDSQCMTIQEEEIQDYKWLSYSNMLELLTFDTDKKVLSEVKCFLDEKLV